MFENRGKVGGLACLEYVRGQAMILTNRKAPVEWKTENGGGGGGGGARAGQRGESFVSETITVKHCYVSICRVNKIMLSKYNNGKQ